MPKRSGPVGHDVAGVGERDEKNRIILLFDVNETLLDLASLDIHFDEVFGRSGLRADWFNLTLRSALTNTLLGGTQNFSVVGRAALKALARREKKPITEDEIERIVGAMAHLKPHGDVVEALERIAQVGYRMAALTNSPSETAHAQLENAGLAGYFERILSAELANTLKPARAVYALAAGEFDAKLSDLWMVAAHDWDIAGAMKAGLHGILLRRRGVAVNPLFPTPDLVFRTLGKLADHLGEKRLVE